MLDEILITQRCAPDSLSAAALTLVLVCRNSLDEALVCDDDNNVFFLYEILVHETVDFMEVDECPSVVAVFLADLSDFLLDLCKHLHLIGKKFLIEGNLDLKLVELVDDLLCFEVAQTSESHLDYGVGLLVGECEALLKFD